MIDEEIGISFLKLNDILNGVETLTDQYEIENVLLSMQQMEKKVEFLKELKRRRTSSIDRQVEIEENNIEILKNAIKNCMTINKKKSLDFPGVGKISTRNTKGTWTVLDEVGLRVHLESLGKFNEVAEESWKFKKKDLNSLLDELKQNNNTSDFVKKEDDKTSISISYPKDESLDDVSTAKTAAKTVSSSVVSSSASSSDLEI